MTEHLDQFAWHCFRPLVVAGPQPDRVPRVIVLAAGTATCLRPHAAMSERSQASRVPSGHGFPATIKNPQPDGMRLAKVSFLPA